MRKLFIVFLLIFCTNIAFSQLSDGKYVFADKDITLSFKVTDDGTQLKDVRITENATNKTEYGNGEWFTLNLNGVGPDYEGPSGWYQFQTSGCNYEFESSNKELKLSRFDCKNSKSSQKFTLYRKR